MQHNYSCNTLRVLQQTHTLVHTAASLCRYTHFFLFLLSPPLYIPPINVEDFTNQTTASSDNQSYSNTTPNRLECSDGFYFDENGSRLCLPACGEWDPFPFVTYSILVSTIVCLVSSMVMIGLALTVQRDKL